MKPVKIFLISPREPSGATWLINCFLELGIKTYRETLGEMWYPAPGGGHMLNPVENHLKKWLPILSGRETFHFRDDIEVEWAHHWPARRHAGHKIVYFVRDPRDALFSRYRRESPGMSFQEFLEFPDPHTLLDKIDNWCLFSELWMSQPDVRHFRFEDYKQDARRTLEDVLDFLGLHVDEPALLAALEGSTFEKAAQAEKKYREANPADEQLINRASQVGNWRASDEAACIADIAGKAASLLSRFGYEPGAADARGVYLPQAEVLGFYRRLAVSDTFWRSLHDVQDASQRATGQAARLMQFMQTLNDDLLRRSGLTHYEIHILLQSLDEFSATYPGIDLEHLQWPHQHRAARLWWHVVDFSQTYNIRLPAWLRVYLWRLRGHFKNRMLKT